MANLHDMQDSLNEISEKLIDIERRISAAEFDGNALLLSELRPKKSKLENQRNNLENKMMELSMR